MGAGQFENTVKEVGSSDKFLAEQKLRDGPVCDLIFAAASSIGALRLLSEKNNWCLKFKGMKYRYANNKDIEIDIGRQIDHVVGRSDSNNLPDSVEILGALEAERDSFADRKQVCKGHDCIRILGRALSRRLGSNNQFNSKDGSEELSGILRLAYERPFFAGTNSYRELKDWEDRAGYQVLKVV
ncbi:MAG: hypothetical protein OEN23_21175 [Paracoccaceae bacterium]|nr:hypothetical protein [Paracoccaceae bacterium]